MVNRDEDVGFREVGRGASARDVVLDDAELASRFREQASDLAPNFAEPWNRRASLAYTAKDYAGAISAIQETLKREPRHFGALAGKGMVKEAMGDEQGALDAFKQALAIDPQLTNIQLEIFLLEDKLKGKRI